jgi:hypothetical protein
MKEKFNPVFLDIAKTETITTVWPRKWNGKNIDTEKGIRIYGKDTYEMTWNKMVQPDIEREERAGTKLKRKDNGKEEGLGDVLSTDCIKWKS